MISVLEKMFLKEKNQKASRENQKVSCMFDSNLATTIDLSMIWTFVLIDPVDQ